MGTNANWYLRSVLAVLTLTVTTAPGRAQELTYSGSVSLATGDYLFAKRTLSAYLTNGLSAELGRFRLSATIPVVLQDSPWISYSAVGSLPTGGTDEGAVDRRRGTGSPSGTGGGQHKTFVMSDPAQGDGPVVAVDTVSYAQLGVGDPAVRLDVQVIRSSGSRPSLSLSASCKPPLAAADRGFGTGSWDAGLGVGTSTRVGRMFLFVTGEYWWFGDMPELQLDDAWSYNLAVGVAILPGRLALLASYSGFTRIIASVDPPRQVGVGVSLTPGRRYSVSLSTSFGLTEGASDFSAGVGWSVRI